LADGCYGDFTRREIILSRDDLLIGLKFRCLLKTLISSTHYGGMLNEFNLTRTLSTTIQAEAVTSQNSEVRRGRRVGVVYERRQDDSYYDESLS